MSALSTIAPKLGKLLPRLGSDHDGEVIATARAIGRTLQSAGLDWHELAAAVDKPPVVLTVTATRPRATAARAAPRPKPSPFDSELLRLVAVLREQRHRVKTGEADFLDGMFMLLSTGRQATFKQAEWVRDIDKRLRAAGAA